MLKIVIVLIGLFVRRNFFQITEYDIHNKCKEHLNGVFNCGRFTNGVYHLSGEDVHTLIFLRVGTNVELIIDGALEQDLNQIQIQIGFCPQITIRGERMHKPIKVENKYRKCYVSITIRDRWGYYSL